MEVNGIKEVFMKNITTKDLKFYIDLYRELGADYETAFMLALDIVY